MTRVFVVLALAVAAVSCQRNPELTVRSTAALSYRELIGITPIVVVGTVAEVKVVGPEIRTSDEHRYPLRLERVTIRAENALKGETYSGAMVFYRYGWSPDHAMVGPWGVLVPGERSVFFLDKEAGILRSIVDLYPANIEVRSGEHAGYKRRAGRSLEESIAELLLTPGGEISPEAFSQELQFASAISIELVGQADTLRLMKPLLDSQEPVLKQRACELITVRFPGQVQCSASSVK